MEVITTKTMMAVKNIPADRFAQRFILAFSDKDKNTMTDGTVINKANRSSFSGVVGPAPELPSISFSIRPGTNNEKKSP